jgi:hypothetical protein
MFLICNELTREFQQKLFICVFVILQLFQHQHQSFVKDLLISFKFDESKLKSFTGANQYADTLAALQKGSMNGGIAAYFDEIPYLKVVLSGHCNQYTMVGRIFKTGGFGFVSILNLIFNK